MKRGGAMAFVALASCGVFDPDPLPPHGEALVVVDTDLPVPSVVSRLRVDIYSADGTWIAHRDDVRPDPRDWPTSFSVFNDDENRERVVRIRLRAYLDARTVAYRGSERLADGITPDVEPDPALGVDRSIELHLVHGTRGRVRVLLRGECVGIADCPGDSPPSLEPTMDRAVPSVVGTFGAEPCASSPSPSSEDRVCVPGGAFVLGDVFNRSTRSGSLEAAPAPERVVRISRFDVDRDEVSVARFRAAIAAGFVPPRAVEALETDGPPVDDITKSCTWSATPRGREDYALSCVSWETASAFCAFAGGDLPTEAQWEWAALAAGRAKKSIYAWGDEAPTCDRAVYGRAPFFPDCVSRGEGPAALADDGDVNALGIRRLAGSLEEHVRDHGASYADACWTNASRIDPVCIIEDDDPRDPRGHVTRGGSWASDPNELRGANRTFSASPASQNPLLGFRCVYPAR